MTDKKLRHIAKIIEKEMQFTNGWRVNDSDYFARCLEAAKKIVKYQKKGRKIKHPGEPG